MGTRAGIDRRRADATASGEIRLALAREVWRASEAEDRRALRASLEREKTFAERVESLLDMARKVHGAAAGAAQERGAQRITNHLAIAVAELEAAAREARRGAARARSAAHDLEAVARAGRPSRAAVFVRCMFEREPSITQDPEAWLRLSEEVPFLGVTWRGPEQRRRDRRRVQQILRRVASNRSAKS